MDTDKTLYHTCMMFNSEFPTTVSDVNVVRVYPMNESSFKPTYEIPGIQYQNHIDYDTCIQSTIIPVEHEAFVEFARNVRSPEIEENPNLDNLIRKFS